MVTDAVQFHPNERKRVMKSIVVGLSNDVIWRHLQPTGLHFEPFPGVDGASSLSTSSPKMVLLPTYVVRLHPAVGAQERRSGWRAGASSPRV